MLLDDLYVDQWTTFWGNCMGHGMGHSKFFGDLAAVAAEGFVPGDIVLATTPDSMFYQHFLDRVAMVMVQVLARATKP